MQTFARKPKTSKRTGRGRGVPALAGRLNPGRQAGSGNKQGLQSPVSSMVEMGGASLANRVKSRFALDFATPEPADRPVGVQFVPANWAGKARIHTDASAAVAAQTRHADAYTQGGDIYFDAGRYRPDLPSGRRLLLHELAHVAQQRNPGRPASTEALEAEADQVTTHALAGRSSRVRLSAAPDQALHQQTNWTTGDVFADTEAAKQIKNQGGLFSGNDQAHVNVSARGKLAYDAGHTTPEDGFRWSKLKNIVDSGHVKIFAVPDSHKFKVKESAKGLADRSIADIRGIVLDPTVMGVTLSSGGMSPDGTYTMIYYDKDAGIGALTHELFGHEWLAQMGLPSGHPPSGSAEEKATGTLIPSHQVTDPFGNIYSGTVRNYIAKYIEALGTNVKVNSAGGGQKSVPKSPTQGVGREAVVKALNDLYTLAATDLRKNQYDAPIAQAWRSLCNNYDLMQQNAEAIRNTNSDLTYTKEIMVILCVLLFNSWKADQQAGFRILLADYTLGRAGFTTNELSTQVEAAVGAAPGLFSPGSATSP
ncbi:eCIS core domain-containing protein [Chitinimonas naiadis]